MVTRPLSGALIALFLTLPILSAWCAACASQECSFSPMAAIQGPERQAAPPQDDANGPAAAAEGHCQQMAMPAADSSAAGSAVTTASFRGNMECCAMEWTSEVELTMLPATSLTFDASAVLAVIDGSIEARPHVPRSRAPKPPRPGPRPLYTLNSAFLI